MSQAKRATTLEFACQQPLSYGSVLVNDDINLYNYNSSDQTSKKQTCIRLLLFCAIFAGVFIVGVIMWGIISWLLSAALDGDGGGDDTLVGSGNRGRGGRGGRG
ncbi:hypothetical protein CHUAL_012206 [Chamberlinius hualienensis]